MFSVRFGYVLGVFSVRFGTDFEESENEKLQIEKLKLETLLFKRKFHIIPVPETDTPIPETGGDDDDDGGGDNDHDDDDGADDKNDDHDGDAGDDDDHDHDDDIFLIIY